MMHECECLVRHIHFTTMAGYLHQKIHQIISVHPRQWTDTIIGFQFRNDIFSARSRKTRCCAETYLAYVAQATPQFDVEIAEKGHLWMETN